MLKKVLFSIKEKVKNRPPWSRLLIGTYITTKAYVHAQGAHAPFNSASDFRLEFLLGIALIFWAMSSYKEKTAYYT